MAAFNGVGQVQAAALFCRVTGAPGHFSCFSEGTHLAPHKSLVSLWCSMNGANQSLIQKGKWQPNVQVMSASLNLQRIWVEPLNRIWLKQRPSCCFKLWWSGDTVLRHWVTPFPCLM